MTDISRIEALRDAMLECTKPAERGNGTVGARDCMEIRSAISDLWGSALCDYDSALRDADKAHRERIHAEIARDLNEALNTCRGRDGCEGDEIVDAIVAGRIRHLVVVY